MAHSVSAYLDVVMDVVLEQVRSETRWQPPGVQELLSQVEFERPQPEFNRLVFSGLILWHQKRPWVLGHGRLPMSFDGVSTTTAPMLGVSYVIPYEMVYGKDAVKDAIDHLLRAWRQMVMMLREVDELYVPQP